MQLQRPLWSPRNPHLQGCVAFLPFVHVSRKSLIPRPYDFEPQILGGHIRKKRLKMGLMQKEAAELLGVSSWTVLNWEKGHTEPPIASVSAILRFLGYNPFPQPKTIAQRLLAKRQVMGWSIKEAARAVGVDTSTWGNWERGKTILHRQHRAVISQFLDLPVDVLDKEMVSRRSKLHWRISP